jgi:hypothetical protein
MDQTHLLSVALAFVVGLAGGGAIGAWWERAHPGIAIAQLFARLRQDADVAKAAALDLARQAGASEGDARPKAGP